MADWTKEQVAKLKELWPTGMTAREIAAIVGKPSRNSVISKANQLGLKPRKAKNGPPVNGPPKRRQVTKPPRQGGLKPVLIGSTMPSVPKAPYVSKPLAAKVVPLMIPLENLMHDECHFPLGDGPFLYCGVKTRRTYCEVHQSFMLSKKAAA